MIASLFFTKCGPDESPELPYPSRPLYSLSPRHEKEKPQKAGAGAGDVVTKSADGHIRPGIGGTEAYNIHGFFVGVLEVIYHTVRRCRAILFMIHEARGRHAVTFQCVFFSPPFPAHCIL